MTRKPESAQPRKGMPSPRLGEDEFKQRFLDQFQDTAFSSLQAELNKMADAAWDGYSHSRKSRVRAGRGRDMPNRTISSPMLGSMPRTRCMPPYGLIGMMPNTGSC
jgi:hypothetical protein